jgi:hypothetical protein
MSLSAGIGKATNCSDAIISAALPNMPIVPVPDSNIFSARSGETAGKMFEQGFLLFEADGEYSNYAFPPRPLIKSRAFKRTCDTCFNNSPFM